MNRNQRGVGIRRRGAVLAVLVALAACQANLPLGVPTTYVIRDLDADTEQRLESAFRDCETHYGFRVIRRSAEGGAFEFALTRVADLNDLRDVARRIAAVSHSAMVPVVLQGATVTFASVQGDGSARIQVSGTGTPDAEVLLDVGGELVIDRVGADGQWAAWVQRSPQLAARGGWIYGAIRKGDVQQFLRMNVLEAGSSERIRAADLPPDSALRSGR